MKTLFVTLAAIAVLLVTGCQENSITDPLTIESANKNQFPDTYLHGFITLEGLLGDPNPVMNSFYKISGEIEYDHRLVSRNYVSLHFSINADFQYLCTVCPPSEVDELAGFISNVSEEYLLLHGIFTIIEKSFPIQGRDDGMVLVCRFKVTAYDVELDGMQLSLEPSIHTNNKLAVTWDTLTYPPVRIDVVQ